VLAHERGMMAKSVKYGRLGIAGIPDDEPVFVLRAKDSVALAAVTMYREMCMLIGCTVAHTDAIQQLLTDFEDWRAAHENQIGFPD